MNEFFSIEHRPSADGAVFHVISPEGTCVWRTPDSEEAITERDRRNSHLTRKAAKSIAADRTDRCHTPVRFASG